MVPFYLCRATTSTERTVDRGGMSGLERIQTKTRYPMIPYFCSKDVIHSYAPAKKSFAASIVLFGPVRNKIPKAWISNVEYKQ